MNRTTIGFVQEKETRGIGALRLALAFSATKKAANWPKACCDILRARLRDCARRRTWMLDRRNFMKTCSGIGLAGTLFPGVLWAQVQAQGAKKINKEMIENAAAIADVPISEEYKEMMLESLNDHAKGYEEIYKLHIPNSVDPALIFDPVLPGMKITTERKPLRMSIPAKPAPPSAPKNLEDLAFASARELAE